ncbi:MAG: S-layer homology domain-containing protein [Clostridiales Family XIII bacterium]|jgi:hypothetical protein|nr:S-layer homology domain-containing protein [Clostridiales Family XIII bacterium]
MVQNRKKLALLLVFVLLAGAFLPGYTRTDGIGNVYYSSHLQIFEGTDFSRIHAGNDANGVERAYVVTADLSRSGLRPFVFAGDISARYVPDTMVNTLEAQGYKVVAGVNGDLFDMDTGCPRGLTVHDGEILTSGYDTKFVISFDETGKADFVWPNVNYAMGTEIFVPQADGSYAQTPYRANIGYVNVPHGGSKSLHLYNRAYGASTGTKGENVEVILNAASPEAARLRFGRPVVATVAAIRYSGGNAPIGDNQLVLSTKTDSATAEALSRMAVDMRVEIGATDLDKGALSRSRECLGMYYLLYDHGKWVSEGTNPNPRTLLGLKNDGSVMLYVLDGRQPGISGGLGLTDAAKHMVALGCVAVANLDGGGSSSMLVREPGIDAKALLKNSPSGGAQRAVANGFFLVYKDLPAGGESVLSAYQDHYLALPGADVKLTAYRSNSLYERTGGGAVRDLRYEVAEGGGSVSGDGVYTAGEAPGKVRIRILSGNVETTAELEVVTRDLSLTPSSDAVFADPRQVLDLNVTARHGYAPVAQKDSLFTWECDAAVGAIDENGVFTATDRTGVSGEIRISYGDKSVSVPVQVGAKITFTDLFDPATGADHWAKPFIESLASQGIVNGIGDDMFGPEFALTRAQFLAMLAKTVDGLDLNASPPSGFEDVPMEGWYYSYVNWGHAAGIVKGVDETHFAPDLPITREQMTVMLANFAATSGLGLPDAGAAPAFTDAAAISPWAFESVDRIARAGIMNGMPAGGFDPQAGATRAQAAKVAYMLCEMKDMQPAPLPPEGGDAGQGTEQGAGDAQQGTQQGAGDAQQGAAGQGTDGDAGRNTPAPEGSGAAETPGDVPVH